MKDELDKMRALHEAATPGPWRSTKYGYEKHSINGDRGVEIASCWRKQNAELIATMHANWLNLIAQAERANALEAENAALKAQLAMVFEQAAKVARLTAQAEASGLKKSSTYMAGVLWTGDYIFDALKNKDTDHDAG